MSHADTPQKQVSGPYKEPAPLDLTGLIPVNILPDLTTTGHMTLTGHIAQPVEEAIYVLTGWCGLVNLHQGRRSTAWRFLALVLLKRVDYELKQGYM